MAFWIPLLGGFAIGFVSQTVALRTKSRAAWWMTQGVGVVALVLWCVVVAVVRK